MRKSVITYNIVEGFHNYPDAPKFCTYLSARHRHLFHIRCWLEVQDNNRQIEINQAQHDIERALKDRFGKPCEFGAMSCEDICEYLAKSFIELIKVEVTEDGYGGASFTR